MWLSVKCAESAVCDRTEHPALYTAMPAVHNVAVLSFGESRHHLCAETQRLALSAARPGWYWGQLPVSHCPPVYNSHKHSGDTTHCLYALTYSGKTSVKYGKICKVMPVLCHICNSMYSVQHYLQGRKPQRVDAAFGGWCVEKVLFGYISGHTVEI